MAYERNEHDYIYSSGCRLALQSHRPPLPFDIQAYKHNQPASLPPMPTASEDQLNYVFCHSLLATEPPNRQDRLEIVIKKQLSSGKSYGAQVLTCHLVGQQDEVRFVKIYDPLYYRWMDGYGNRRSVVRLADGDYSRETAAYCFLDEQGCNGTLAPKYYGSWTFSLGGRPGETRSVRLILLEYIPAPSLWQEYYHRPISLFGRGERVPPNRLVKIPETYGNFDDFRAKVYLSVLVIKAKQVNLGLAQRDLAPRNFLAVLEDSNSQNLSERLQRVVLVDYNIAIVYPLSNMKVSLEALPPNPLEVHWDRWLHEFDGWIPRSWQENRELHREWLYDNFGLHERRKKYMPLSSEFSETLRTWCNSRSEKGS